MTNRRSCKNDVRSQRLSYDYLKDLVVDIRCARRDGLSAYAEQQVQEFRRVWRWRNVVAIGRYGIPITTTV